MVLLGRLNIGDNFDTDAVCEARLMGPGSGDVPSKLHGL